MSDRLNVEVFGSIFGGRCLTLRPPLPLSGGYIVRFSQPKYLASLDDITSASKGRSTTVSPNETGAPIMGSSGQRASIRSCRGFLFPRPLRPGHNGIVQKPAWYKCIRSAET